MGRVTYRPAAGGPQRAAHTSQKTGRGQGKTVPASRVSAKRPASGTSDNDSEGSLEDMTHEKEFEEILARHTDQVYSISLYFFPLAFLPCMLS